MPSDPQQEQPGLSPQQYQQLLHFLVTWAGLTPEEARDRLSGQSPPALLTRSSRPPVRRPIYPPKVVRPATERSPR